ncbi:MAG TPA: class I SAM-dependent methyltransferase [Bacillota bacterium]|nr:class I SAM-dependent methyltransferase [Bacillota bacterium]
MSAYLDAVTALGRGSLHPGGFSHTLQTLRRLSISPDDIVFDIGCGTGRTACHIAKTYGAYVFALDNSEKMLAKARSRAAQEGAVVNFVLGDALDLPFRDVTADFIIIESVLIFLPVRDVLRECFRVLKKGGVLVDIELIMKNSLPPAAAEQIRAFCGLFQLPGLEEWIDFFREAGFTRAEVRQNRFPGFVESLRELFCYDPFREVSRAKTDWNMIKTLFAYMSLMAKNRKHLGYGTFILTKD